MKASRRWLLLWGLVWLSPSATATADDDDGNTTTTTDINATTEEAPRCFTSHEELRDAVRRYVATTAAPENGRPHDDGVRARYGTRIGDWCIGHVTSLHGLFQDADAFEESLAGWNTSSVTDFSYLFAGAGVFDGDLSAWYVAWHGVFAFVTVGCLFDDVRCAFVTLP